MTKIITENIDLWTSSIKAKNTVGRGSSKKLELYGIKKLRELILELAVRGLLVPQDQTDEPASELLKGIKKKKTQLIKENKLNKQKPLPDSNTTEFPFVLPIGWRLVRLGEVANVVRGVTYKKSDATDTLQSDTTPLMRANNIGTGLNFDNFLYIPTHIVKAPQFIVSGDILLAMSSGSANLVGKAAQAKSDLGNTFGAFCAVIRSFVNTLHPYFGFYFQTPNYRNQTSKSGKGIGIQNLHEGALLELQIPLPPLAEQQRIVAKVDELMALCDQLEQQTEDQIDTHETLVKTLLDSLTSTTDAAQFQQAWQQIEANFDLLFTTPSSIDHLKQTILQLAVMGKLVPQDPTDEPASQLLKKIATEKEQLIKDKKIKKQKLLPPITDSEKSFNVCNGWEWTRLTDITSKITDGDHQTPQRLPTGKFLLSAKNVRDGYVDFENCDLISEADYTKSRERCLPEEGDLMMVSVGGTIGRSSMVPSNSQFALVRSVALMKPLGFEPKYFKLVADSPILQKSIHSNKRGGAQPCLYLSEISKFLVPLPPLSEQQRIVTKVDTLMTLCDTLKAQLQSAQTTQLHLTDTLVEQAVN